MASGERGWEESITRAVQGAIRSVLTDRQETSSQLSSSNATTTTTSSSTSSTANEAAESSSCAMNGGNRELEQTTLPSIFGGASRSRSLPPAKRSKRGGYSGRSRQVTKDVVCLPPSDQEMESIPRGNHRGRLAEKGLIGKVSFYTSWSETQVKEEISSVFRSAFKMNGGILPYIYMSIVHGSKKLAVPKISTTFRWNGSEVASIAKQGAIYIRSLVRIPDDTGSSESETDDVVEVHVHSPPNEDGDPEQNIAFSTSISFSNDSHSTLGNNNSNRSSSMSNNSISNRSSEAPETFRCPESTALSSTCTPVYRSYVSLLDDDEFNFNPAVLNDDDDRILQEVIQLSASSTREDIKEILREHIANVMNETDETRNFINVRRSNVLSDGLAKIARASFLPSRRLSVKFADDIGQSEGAVDLGGPTREFLRLSVRELFESSMFAGEPGNRVLVPNAKARRDNQYKWAGKLISVSICNGGEAGNSLAECLFNLIAIGEHACKPTINEVPHSDVQHTLEQLRNVDNEADFTELIWSSSVQDHLSNCGYNCVPTFGKREELVAELCHYFVVDRVRTAIEMFKEGLTTLDILECIQKYPAAFRRIFCNSENTLTSENIDQAFVPQFDAPGSNSRIKQETAVMNWRDYLQNCAAGLTKVSLCDILVFATGASRIPPMGFFPQPTLSFWEDVRPKANTCGTVLYLPTKVEDFERFQEMMDDGIMNSPFFGMA